MQRKVNRSGGFPPPPSESQRAGPVERLIQKVGATSLQAISDALNARGVRTARGGMWAPMTVKRILDRAMFRSRAGTTACVRGADLWAVQRTF